MSMVELVEKVTTASQRSSLALKKSVMMAGRLVEILIRNEDTQLGWRKRRCTWRGEKVECLFVCTMLLTENVQLVPKFFVTSPL